MTTNYEEFLKLGLIKVNQKNFIDSKKIFLDLIKLDKKRYEGYLNLSNILVLENKQNEAIELLQSYLNTIKKHPEIINGLAIQLFNYNKFEQLILHVDCYIKKFDNYLLNYLKGYCLSKDGSSSKSEIFLKNAIKLNRNFWPAYELMFNIYDLRSKIDAMGSLINKSKKYFTNNFKFQYFEALYNYRTSDFKNSLDILNNEKTKSIIGQNENKQFLVDYYNLLSKNYGKILNYKLCLYFALERNKILINLDQNKAFDKNDLLQTINTYTKFFNVKSRSFSGNDFKGLEHTNLTFLVGFPRSGTTLLDTILRTHSKTQVIEEKPYLLDTRHEFFKKNNISNLLNLDEKNIIKLQEMYFQSFNYDSKKRIIDKFPLNLLELGFIKTVFPNSKIILAIRHPLDCILSCVLTAFKINEAMINFENLKTTAFFYNSTFTLMIKYIEFFKINL